MKKILTLFKRIRKPILLTLSGTLVLLIITNPSPSEFDSYANRFIDDSYQTNCIHKSRISNNFIFSRYQFRNTCDYDKVGHLTIEVTAYLGKFKVDWQGYKPSPSRY